MALRRQRSWAGPDTSSCLGITGVSRRVAAPIMRYSRSSRALHWILSCARSVGGKRPTLQTYSARDAGRRMAFHKSSGSAGSADVAHGAEHPVDRLGSLELLLDRPVEIGAEALPVGRQVAVADPDQTAEAGVLAVEALDLARVHRPAEVGMSADVGVEQRRVHPGVGGRLERGVALAIGLDAFESLVELPQPPSHGHGVPSPVLEDEQIVEGPEQPVPWTLLEVGVVAHAGADRGMRDLEQQRIEHRQEQAHIRTELPGHRLWTDEQVLDLVVCGKEAPGPSSWYAL